MKTSGKIVLYGLYALAAVCVFLYLLFPSQKIGALIMERLSQLHPEVQVNTRQARPVFPPGLKLEPLSVDYGAVPIMRMPHVKIMPAFFSLFGSERQIAFSGPVGRGVLKGQADFTAEPQKSQTKLVMNVSEVPLEALDFVRNLDYPLSGELTAYVDYDSRKGSGGTSNIKMQITPAKIVFDPPLLGLAQVEFTQLDSELTLTSRLLQIRRCELNGAQIQGRITGSIVFKEPLQKSRLTLSCTLKPQPAFLAEHKSDGIGALLGSPVAQQRGIILRISGTLDSPNYVVR